MIRYSVGVQEKQSLRVVEIDECRDRVTVRQLVAAPRRKRGL